LGVCVEARELNLAVGALEVVAVDVELALDGAAGTRAFVAVGRSKRGADVVSYKTRNRFVKVHAKRHQEPSPCTGRYSHVCVSSSKNGSRGGCGGGGGGGTVVDACVSVSMKGVPEPAKRPVARS